ncbi:hypothetical protein ACTJKT_30045 [Pseudomonas sp. 22526]|uniref:hypothetical protein n=1 Tax=Pseudomonas TaxID=286 RepID=UPI0004B1350A|nr:hypothetical protein [Pseudomonas chlororaphis]AZC33416.1 hypothetical protein C4K38_5482 [Pseudomonas chlororaphis subsp. piscium]AZC39971.1 hypothetical protein C4K37_5610 [Pseudomonas chlororaphis subsp. piscium]AZC46528.1 hypothetical protein C4K36_5629 [Pseudomonas chlororaphis subsp. piscium]AZC53218.1 hypothetical protein C4K35_5661 [Pseudomonas chlororaphis subsp. piscium]AZC59515.1 hypothetical protein C4K34_5376 [Pseudomonas chlororaphis subsp. piscium]
MKTLLFVLLCLGGLLLVDCSVPVRAEETSSHWCLHELHRALGDFFFPQTS